VTYQNIHVNITVDIRAFGGESSARCLAWGCKHHVAWWGEGAWDEGNQIIRFPRR